MASPDLTKLLFAVKKPGQQPPPAASNTVPPPLPGDTLGEPYTPTEQITATIGDVHDPTLPSSESQSTAPAPLLSGTIQQYEIIREIGRGGMGAVYLARDTRLGRLVAIKVLAKRGAHFVLRFLAEARATARFSHENIVVIHEVNVYQDHPYMVLQFLEGQTLRQWMEERARESAAAPTPDAWPVSVHSAVEIMIPVLRALVCAHEQGMVHRDLKPENIMLTTSGTVKVLDFGIAKLLSGSEDKGISNAPQAPEPRMHMTHPGAMLGTLPYMSPEQLGGSTVDHRSDIWAVGIILYELLLGKHPLAPLSKAKLAVIADLDTAMPSAAEQAPELGGLGAIIDRCLIKDVRNRIASAAELLAELEALAPTKGAALISGGTGPFAGLSAFQESDADRFFGREREVASTVAQLRRQPLLTLAGPSGAGKSSLVRAGVIPALKRSGEGWDAFITRPGRRPLAALVGLLEEAQRSDSTASKRASTIRGAMDGEEPGKETSRDWDRLRHEPGYLGAVLRARAGRKQRRILLFVDQFEELYTLGASPAERAAFVACLEGAADDAAAPVRVILSIRSDFLDRMAEDRALTAEVSRGLLFIAPMMREGLRQALTCPIEAAGHRFESPDLIESMLNALEARRGALPLLQFTATKLWELRDRERRLLTEASYQAIGGVAGALASHADTVLAGLSVPKQSLARQIFRRLVTPERTRAIVSMSELRELAPSRRESPGAAGGPDAGDAGEIDNLVQHLSSMRLLVVESSNDGSSDDGGGHTVELVHESLIDGWPTLARWLDEEQEDTAFLARLRSTAKEWEASARAEGLLWRGQPAAEARAFDARYRGELTQRERAYLNAVISLANRNMAKKRRVIAATIGILAVLLLAASVALVRIRRQAAELRQASAMLEQTLRGETAQKAAAEAARREAEKARAEAEAAKQDAEDEAARARAALADARLARDAAQDSEAKARLEKLKADQAAREARLARDHAKSAEAKAKAETSKADQAAQEAAASKEEKQQIIERAVGPIKREL